MSGSDTPISRRRFLCTTAGAAASVGFGACGFRASEPPQVTVWMAGAPGRPPMEQPALDAFHKAQSRVRVTAITHEYEDLPVKLIAALEAGAGIPDVCLLDTEYLGMVLDKGGLLDLSQPPYDAGQYEGDFVRSAWRRGVVDRRLLAVPWATYPGSMWYRADILGSAGLDTDPRQLRERIETWDDFLQLGMDLKRRGGIWLMGSPYSDMFGPALAQKGFGWVDGYRLLLEEKLTEPLALAARAHEMGLDPLENYAVDHIGEKLDTVMRQGKIAAMAGSSGNPIYTAKRYPESVGKWRAVRPPGGDLEWGAAYMVVPEKARQLAAAWEFVRWVCCSSEGQNASFLATGGLPAYRPAWDDPLYDRPVSFFGGQQVYRVWTEAAENAPAGVLSLLGPGVLDDIVLGEFELAMDGKDPRQAMRDAEAAALRRIPGVTRAPEREPTTQPEQASARRPSGGLGLTVTEWEEEHGKIETTFFSEDGYPVTELTYYKVYGERSTNRIFRVEYVLRWQKELETARTEARSKVPTLLPSDAKLVESAPAEGVQEGWELYESEYLKGLYPEAETMVVWGQAQPGIVTVKNRAFDDSPEGHGLMAHVSTGDTRSEP